MCISQQYCWAVVSLYCWANICVNLQKRKIWTDNSNQTVEKISMVAAPIYANNGFLSSTHKKTNKTDCHLEWIDYVSMGLTKQFSCRVIQ